MILSKNKKKYLLIIIIIAVVGMMSTSAYIHRDDITNGFSEGWSSTK